MRGAADREKLGQSLQGAEHECLETGHDLELRSERRYSSSYFPTIASRENRWREYTIASSLNAVQREGCGRSIRAAAAIPATSPTPHNTAVSPSRFTSGRPPALVPITGTPEASASSALRPNDSV